MKKGGISNPAKQKLKDGFLFFICSFLIKKDVKEKQEKKVTGK